MARNPFEETAKAGRQPGYRTVSRSAPHPDRGGEVVVHTPPQLGGPPGGGDPGMTYTKPPRKTFRQMLDDRDYLPPHKQLYKKPSDLPPGILQLLKKDPNFNWKTFKKIGWADPGYRWTDPYEGFGMRGSYYDMGEDGPVIMSTAPFGESGDPYQIKGPWSLAPMGDMAKAKVAMHEARHKDIIESKENYPDEYVTSPHFESKFTNTRRIVTEKPNTLHYSQPEWVKEHPMGIKYESGRPYMTGHELYNRFLGQRYFPPDPVSGPHEPYFDKILKDYWEPNALEYERIAKKNKMQNSGLGGLLPNDLLIDLQPLRKEGILGIQ